MTSPREFLCLLRCSSMFGCCLPIVHCRSLSLWLDRSSTETDDLNKRNIHIQMLAKMILNHSYIHMFLYSIIFLPTYDWNYQRVCGV